MEPRVLHRKEGIQLCYDLPHRIYATCVYPHRSHNGSSIIVYGHERGLRLVWYGGRKLRPGTSQTIVNGSGSQPTNTKDESLVDYESDEEEIDSSRPFRDVLSFIEVPFGSAATHISIPHLPLDRTTEAYAPILEDKIVVAAVCADQSIRIVSVPLQPQNEPGQVLQSIKLSPSGHQDLVEDIAVTLTAEESEDDKTEKRTRSRSQGRLTNEEQKVVPNLRKWSLLIATASATGNGLLVTHQIPIIDQTISQDPDDHIPIYRQFLRSSLTSCRLSFNPSPCPADRHSHLLIAAPDGSFVKIYETLPQTETSRRRRGSTTTMESTTSTGRPSRQIHATSGRLLMTLLPTFRTTGEQEPFPLRKRILDAKWILHGRAIVVLLEDGEWGIWDLEATGPAPTANSNNLVKGHTNVTGIRGGSITQFAVRGYLGGAVLPTKSSGSGNRPSTDLTLAPMTPHTRKSRASGLFQGQSATNASTSTGNLARGSISIGVQGITANGSYKTREESILFNYSSTTTYIPSAQAYWRADAGGKGSFDTFGSSRSIALPYLQVGSEVPIAAHLLPHDPTTLHSASKIPPFLAASSSRIILLVPALMDSLRPSQTVTSLPMRLFGAKSSNPDQTLLESGELDVDGMDRMLDNMAHSNTEQSTMNGFGKKSVGFQLEKENEDADDEDVDMNSPTLSRNVKSKLIVQRNGSESRRLFT